MNRIIKKSREILYEICIRIAGFFIDVACEFDDSPLFTLREWLVDKGLVDCPWCKGEGFLTALGEVIERQC